jgi:hypothetical protein
MVNSEELIGAAEHVMFYNRRCLNRRRYNRVKLYMALRD